MKSMMLEEFRERISGSRPDGAEPSDLHASFTGYFFDIASNAMEVGFYDLRTRSKEIFPTAAKFADSVYLHAVTSKITDFFATPAKIDVLVALREKDIIRYAKPRPGLGYNMVTMSRNTELYLADFYYLLDYPVDIIVKEGYGGTKLISCKYDMTDFNEFSDINSTFVSGASQVINGESYYVIKVRAHQLAKTSNDVILTQSNKTSDVYTFAYLKQLAGIHVFYRKNDEDAWEKVELVYNGVLVNSTTKKYCYYRLGENTFDISFGTNPTFFIPEFNSRMRVEFYYTDGSSGNFDFTQDQVVLRYHQDRSNIFEDAFTNISSFGQLLSTGSAGGKDKPTLDELRENIVTKKSTRGVIISENDIARVMKPHGMELVKVRDDILARTFSTYCILQDKSVNYVIPSRTGQLWIRKAEVINQYEVDSFLVPTNAVFQKWLSGDLTGINNSRFEIKPEDEDGFNATNALESKNWKYLYNLYNRDKGLLMMCPYLIRITKDPYTVSVFDIQCSDHINTTFGYNNTSSPEKFAINTINVVRSDIRNKEYFVYCDVIVSDVILSEFENMTPTSFPVSVKVELLDSRGYTHSYIPLDTVEVIPGGKLRFGAVLKTADILRKDGSIQITSGNVIPTTELVYKEEGIIPQVYFIPFNALARAYVAYRPATNFPNEYAEHMLTRYEEESGFVITDMFETHEKLVFVHDLTDVFILTLETIMTEGTFPKYTSNIPMYYDTVVFQRDDEGNVVTDAEGVPVIVHDIGDPVYHPGTTNPVYRFRKGDLRIEKDSEGNFIYETPPDITFIVHGIPLVAMSAMLDNTKRNAVYESLRQTTDALYADVLPKLVENNSIAVNLYNTVGPSDRYVIGSKGEYKLLDNIDISIELNVKFKSNYNVTILRSSIIQSISQFIQVNTNNGVLYMSDIIEYIKKIYSDVEYIEFVSINGLDTKYQTIKQSDVKLSQSDRDLVPEYITIKQVLDEQAFKKDGTVKLSPDITINVIT
jgi:hypothetical protein